MFVRWIVRGHKNADSAGVTFHDAYLVVSFRDEAGEPRQRTLAYLGNIRQIDGVLPAIERELFLLRAEIILNSTPGLSDLDRGQVLGQLHRKVPPLTAEEIKVGFFNTLHWYFRWWQDNGGAPTHAELLALVERVQQAEAPLGIAWDQ
jgi:hypothetical protein